MAPRCVQYGMDGLKAEAGGGGPGSGGGPGGAGGFEFHVSLPITCSDPRENDGTRQRVCDFLLDSSRVDTGRLGCAA